MFERTFATIAQYAEAVRVIDCQQRVVFLGELQQFRQRCNVAVHAENGIGDDQFAARVFRVREHRLEFHQIAMRISLEVCARQQRGIVE